MKERLKRLPILSQAWTRYRASRLEFEYTRRRDRYAKKAKQMGISYSGEAVIDAVRDRLRKRGYVPKRRAVGEVHTFACIAGFAWHEKLLPDLEELGPLSRFDYTALGYSPDDFYGFEKWDSSRIARRKEMVEKIVPAFARAHEQRPVDWVFCYGGGQEVSAQAVSEITEKFGVPTVNMTFDDKHGWVGPKVGEHRTGAQDLTRYFDLFLTSSRICCEWHMVEGGRAIYAPEGFDANSFHPMPCERDIKVSFVGQRYGFRESVVRYLSRNGVDVQTFGHGWPNGPVDDIAEIFNRSEINLGMGGIGYSENLKNLKGRDFDIPGTGGGVYLTSFNPDLAQHFKVGEEILCYGNRHEMLELIRYCLSHPEETRGIAKRARDRCLEEHRWLHRYEKALAALGIVRR